MILLGLDLETGHNYENKAEKAKISELGVVIWDTDHNMPVDMANVIVKHETPVAKVAEEYTGLMNEIVDKYGKTLGYALHLLVGMHNRYKPDFIVAHNAFGFDRDIVIEALKDFTEWKTPPMQRNRDEVFGTPWIDTIIDVPYPKKMVQRNLTYLAGAHLILNSFPHRALTDVLTMFSVASQYDWETIATSARSPMVKMKWNSTYPDRRNFGTSTQYQLAFSLFENKKNIVSKFGFKYDGQTKEWTKADREINFAELLSKPEISKEIIRVE